MVGFRVGSGMVWGLRTYLCDDVKPIANTASNGGHDEPITPVASWGSLNRQLCSYEAKCC